MTATTPETPSANSSENGDKESSFSGALMWSYVMFGGRQLVMLVVTFVLAAILGPEAYGTVAMAQIFIVLVQIVQRQGLIPALVHIRDLRDEHLNTAYWLVVVASIVVVALSFPFGVFYADITNLPDLEQLVPVMALGLPLRGSALIPEAVFQRNMDFKSLAIRTNVATLIGGAVGIGVALAGGGAWALAFQALTADVVDSVAIWTMTKFRPKLKMDRQARKQILQQASGTSIAGLANFVRQRGDLLVIGVVFGAVPAGLYRLATRFTDMILELTMRGIQGVSLPELARLQHDPEKLRGRFLDIIRLTSLVSIPLLGIMAAVAPEAVGLLGSEWEDAAIPLVLLAVATAGQLHPLMTTPALQAVGRYKALAFTTWTVAVMVVLAAVIPLPFIDGKSELTQLVTVAAARAVMLAIMILPLFRWAYKKFFDLPFGEVMAVQLPSIVSAVAAFLAVSMLRVIGIFSGLPLIPRGMVYGIAASAAAFAVLFVTEPMIRDVKSQFKAMN